MAKSNHIHNSFIAGEISPRAFGRTDIQQYNQACEVLENMLVYPEGGVGRRPGTIAKKVFSSVRWAKPIPFKGTDGTRWQLLLTDQDPYDALSGGLSKWVAYNVEDGSEQNITSRANSPRYTAYLPGVTAGDISGEYDCSSTFNYHEIQYAQSGDTIVIVHGSFPPIIMQYDYTQSSGSRFFMSKFPCLMNAVWDSVGAAISPRTRQMPFVSPTDTSTTITLTIAGGGSSKYLTSSDVSLGSTWVGRFIKLQDGADSLLLYATSWDSGTSRLSVAYAGGKLSIMTTNGTYPYGATNAGSSWTQGEWNSTWGWPRTVAFYDSRLVFGGTETFPDKIWLSQINDIFEFDERGLESDSTYSDPLVATDPFSVTLKQSEYSEIRWISPGKTLPVGTDSGEFIVTGPDQAVSVSIENVSSNVETSVGGALIQVIRFGGAAIFVARGQKSLVEMVYNNDENSFNCSDLNVLASHMAVQSTHDMAKETEDRIAAGTYGHTSISVPGAIVALTKVQSPYGMIWALDANGRLLGLTRNRTQGTVAWHRHRLGGLYNLSEEINLVEPRIQAISAISRPALSVGSTTIGETDELWMVVERISALNGDRSLILEKMAQEWAECPIFSTHTDLEWDFDVDKAPVYLDCAVFVDSDTPGDLTAGVTRDLVYFIEGQIVTVVMNGHYLGDFTVDEFGKIDISNELTADELAGTDHVRCIIGFNYLGRVVPVVPEVPAQLGSSMGQLRRVDQISLHFYRSLGCRYGKMTSLEEENTPLEGLDEITFPDAENAGDPDPLYTGMKTVNFQQGYERRPQVLIESHLPFPMVLTHVVARMVVNE
jgi:hypothetical protein